MSAESDLDSWRRVWKGAATEERPKAIDIRREAMHNERRLKRKHILELSFAAVLIIFGVFVLAHNFNAETLAWAIVLWVLTLGATAFSIWNWRSLWKGANQSTFEYTAAYRKRCMASLRAIRFGYGLLAVDLMVGAPWLTWDFFRNGASGGFGMRGYATGLGLLALLTTVFLVGFRRSRRRTMSELARLEEFEHSLLDLD